MAGRASALLGRRSECDALDRLLDAARARREPRAGAARGARRRQDGPAALRRRARVGVPRRARRRRPVGDGDRVRGPASAVRAAARSARRASRPAARRAAHDVRAERRRPRRIASSSGWRCWACSPTPPRSDRCVCVVDDAQWLDQASEQALTFVARRLLAEPIALVFARRDLGSDREPTGLPELAIGGLRPVRCPGLLASAVSGPLDERVRDRIVAETRGNPLALLELPRGMTPAELAGGFGLPDAHGAARAHRGELRTARAGLARRLAAAAAARGGGAGRRSGAGVARRPSGSRSRSRRRTPRPRPSLLELDHRVRFPHPLVRSAVYRAASAGERQAVHRALAEVTDRALDPDRRAWHRARAAAGPDEAVAEELERSAGRAQARGGVAAEAAFLAQAAELTPDPARRAERQLAAADAKRRAGAFEPALALLARGRGRAARASSSASGSICCAPRSRSRSTAAATRPELLLRAAKQLEPLDARAGARDVPGGVVRRAVRRPPGRRGRAGWRWPRERVQGRRRRSRRPWRTSSSTGSRRS